jgi:hypothetical protein
MNVVKIGLVPLNEPNYGNIAWKDWKIEIQHQKFLCY